MREDLRERALKYALKVIGMVKSLPNEIAAREVTRQVVRSSTSIGANLEEAFAGISKKDFIHSVNISRKEANETRYWLKIILGAGWNTQERLNDILSESEEWIKILTSIVKKNQMRVFAVFLFVLSLCPYPLSLTHASSGASFLKLGVGARALGLGSAYTAVADDVTALYWNPAGLSQINKKEISAMHAELYADTKYDFIGYAHPIGNREDAGSRIPDAGKDTGTKTLSGIRNQASGIWTFGIGAAYLGQGTLEGRGDSREQTSDFTASDLALTFGGSKVVNQKTSLGMNLKVIQSKISGYSATGFAFDFGFMSNPLSLKSYPLTLGFAVQNVGPQMKFSEEGYDLPLTFAGGAGIKIISNILISADVKYQPYDSKTSFSSGLEFTPLSMISLRAGYLAASNTGAISNLSGANRSGMQNQISNLTGINMGLGLKIGPGSIDYSFTPAGELGNAQRISASYRF